MWILFLFFLLAPVSYYCLIFFIGLRPKLGNTYYHIKVAIKEYRIWANVFWDRTRARVTTFTKHPRDSPRPPGELE